MGEANLPPIHLPRRFLPTTSQLHFRPRRHSMSTSSLTVETASLRAQPPPADERWLEVVEHQVSALKFGSVHITVHEGRVVQVETSVRVRFDKAK